MVNDPVADLITRIRNASAVAHESVSVPYSKLKEAIATKLHTEGYVGSVETDGKDTKKELVITLRYEGGTPAITGVDRISKPGRRLYAGAHELMPYKQGKGSWFLSTPKGILTDKEARKENEGGEILFRIW